MFSKEFIQEVKNKTDIVQLIKSYTLLDKAGSGIWQGMCPHPKHNDKTPSFRVWEKEQSWACMGCHNGSKGGDNYGSDAIAFIQWIHNISFKQAIIKIAEFNGIPLPTDENEHIYANNMMLTNAYKKSLPTINNYLYSRGLSDSDIAEWQIGYNNHIVFPLIDIYHRVLGFNKRKFNNDDPKQPKYKNSRNSEIFNKRHYMYGIHKLDKEFNEIRITEGPFDVILAHKYGVKNVLATLGTAITEGHIEIIKRLGKTPVFCMDGDQAGQKAVLKAIDTLALQGIYSKILFLPEDKDLADISLQLRDNIEDYINSNAITYGQYKIQKLVNQYDAKTNELKIQLYPDILNTLKYIKHPVERKVIIDYIENKMDLKF